MNRILLIIKGLSIYLLLFFADTANAQVIDFENVPGVKIGDPIAYLTVPGNDCKVEFFIGFNLQDTAHLTLQRVGNTVKTDNALSGGFQGIINDKDCQENKIPITRMNQINYKPFVLNSHLTNRERVGCQFVSTVISGDSLPSIFISFSLTTKACSGDILDLDGANNAIEAYEIYHYKTFDDFPAKPISNPIEIRTTGKSFGLGEIGDDGGVVPFQINGETPFQLIEIRPNMQVNPENVIRDIFGFALDNFSPFELEQPPYLPPYMSGESVAISTQLIPRKLDKGQNIYFDFDSDVPKKTDKLKTLIADLKQHPSKRIQLTAYTDQTGDASYNLALAKRRAEAVKKVLVDAGVKPNQISIHTVGEDVNSQLKSWEKRRVTVSYL